MRDPNTCGDLRGLSYVNWVRCSTKEQADTSIDDQLAICNRFAQAVGMRHGGDYVLDGVSGLSGKVQETVRQILDRQARDGDVDVVLIHDFSRLTRSGPLDGAAIERDLRDAGIRLVAVMDDVPDDDYGQVIKSLKHLTSHQYSKAVALATTRGNMTSLERGDKAYTNRPPFGVDRLISGPEGPRYVLRNLRDGGQIMFGPDETVLRHLGSNEGGVVRHYRKQGDETVRFVPGDPADVALVNRIYRMHYIEGLGCGRIARRLNDEGVLGPEGGRWYNQRVSSILRNPAYTGRGLTNRETLARHYQRSTEGPQPTPLTPADMANRKRPRSKRRPEEQWYWTQEAGLRGLLDERLRELAIPMQDAYWRKWASKQLKRGCDRHVDSPFILKNRMVCKPGGHRMTGRTFKQKGVIRYYGVNKRINCQVAEEKVLRRLIPAAPVERLVIEMLAKLTSNLPRLRDLVLKELRHQLRRAGQDGGRPELIQPRLEQVEASIKLTIRNAHLLGEEEATRQLADLTAERDRLRRELEGQQGPPKLTEANAAQLLDAVLREVEDRISNIQELGMPAIGWLLDLLVERIEVDLETRHVEVVFSLPRWALEASDRLCLENGTVPDPGNETDSRVPLITWRGAWLGDRYVAVGKRGAVSAAA